MARYVPDMGDIVWLNFDPQAGHEQAGHRPALVLSPAAYNRVRGMMICCPMTSQIKGYPFEVLISQNPASAVLSDQLKSVDWKARNASKKGQVPQSILQEVQAKIRALLAI
ncbi:MAG TPA: endoribonuclease MazF [Rhizorhapis sp.]|nr:endoribonuclease MazF [Rhizorhapis sp.]